MQPQVGRLIEPRDVLKQRTGLRPRFGHGHDVGIPRRIVSALVGDEGVVVVLPLGLASGLAFGAVDGVVLGVGVGVADVVSEFLLRRTAGGRVAHRPPALPVASLLRLPAWSKGRDGRVSYRVGIWQPDYTRTHTAGFR